MRVASVAGVLIALASLVACDRDDQISQPFDFERRVGWMHGPCLAIADDSLEIDNTVTVVVLAEPQALAEGTIGERALSGDDCPALIEDRRAVNENSGNTFYRVVINAGMPSDSLAIGILQPVGPLTAAAGPVSGDIDGDGGIETFSYCTSSEGFHFRVSSGADAVAQSKWSDYYYVGYDMEPTCP